MSIAMLELADFLLIAEAVLEMPAKTIAVDADLSLADSALHAPVARFAGEEFYPRFATKAAVLCAHLIKNHPLKDGNAPVALIATVEFCQRNGYTWSAPDGEEAAARAAELFLRVAAEPLSDQVTDELARFIAERIGAALPGSS
jgi:death-on-curing protein